ncbi:helix-turn-helix domain-containing protein [Kribbella sp. NBC_00482]|uniref:AfsR/SARP family transcriptional regulator n=1 Tax=Kribbella sp. NBC_00482 TaxID=2975968 RepID=UPI002E190CAC
MAVVTFEFLRQPRAWHGRHRSTLGTPRQQGLLAVLALNANHELTKDELLTTAWDDPPPAGVKVVASYIYRIRSLRPEPDLRLRSERGYLLRPAR